jgi:two-component system OmpR family response regulator
VKVLIIEDEKKIASFVRKGLEAQGFVVEVSPHGDEGYALAVSRPYDALVLDIMLPGRDGLSILRNLRERKIALPVILLTARSELNERLEGLNLGADDYLTKPFHMLIPLPPVVSFSRNRPGLCEPPSPITFGMPPSGSSDG